MYAYIYIHTCRYTYIQKNKYTYMLTHVNTHAPTNTHAHKKIDRHTPTHANTRIHIHTHTHTQTHSLSYTRTCAHEKFRIVYGVESQGISCLLRQTLSSEVAVVLVLLIYTQRLRFGVTAQMSRLDGGAA